MDLPLQPWQLWIVAGLLAGALEIKLSGFVMMWMAIGAFVAALMAGLGFSVPLQLAVFIAVSAVLFAASRTIFQKAFMRNTPDYRVGVDAMVDSEAVVVEALPKEGTGTVRINGELWSARSVDGPVATGELVRVDSVDGLKLKVRKASSAPFVVTTKEGNRS